MKIKLSAIQFVVFVANIFMVGCATRKNETISTSTENLSPIAVIAKGKVSNISSSYVVRVFPNRVVDFEGKSQVNDMRAYHYVISESDYSDFLNAFDKFEFNKMNTGTSILGKKARSGSLPQSYRVSLNLHGKEEVVIFPPLSDLGQSNVFMRTIQATLGLEKYLCPHPIQIKRGNYDFCAIDPDHEDKIINGDKS